MITNWIETTSQKYPLFIGQGIIKHLNSIIEKVQLSPSSILIITDEKVGSYYLNDILGLFQNRKNVYHYIVPCGEKAKSIDTFYRCHTYALSNGLDRSSLIIALGGGVVGDLAGFVASTFMRGIPFIQVPTTVLAHDSAVGGKVGINHELGKNMIGAFYQPRAVLYDMNFLQTLPFDEIRSGFAEVIKHSLIHDKTFYHLLKSNVNEPNELTLSFLQSAIEKGILIKASVVSQDEHESGLRAILNFGHTLGHAIEGYLGYGNISHGDAVAIGMLYAIKVSEKVYQKDLGYMTFYTWFDKLGYPVNILRTLPSNELIKWMKKDKKVKSGEIRMVLLFEVGSVEIKSVSEELLLSILLEMGE
ncbi:3-dehydroquinate synthase [Bacillus timonensis]|nr:3-dehydroquinate synthase [Bacillus timonensis]